RRLVVMLHGTGATAAWTRGETRLGDFAAAHGFLAAFPEGLPPDPDRPPHFLDNPPRWIPLPEHDRFDDLGFLTAVLDDAARPGRRAGAPPPRAARPGARLRPRLLQRGVDDVPAGDRGPGAAGGNRPGGGPAAGPAPPPQPGRADAVPGRRRRPADAAGRRAG